MSSISARNVSRRPIGVSGKGAVLYTWVTSGEIDTSGPRYREVLGGAIAPLADQMRSEALALADRVELIGNFVGIEDRRVGQPGHATYGPEGPQRLECRQRRK